MKIGNVNTIFFIFTADSKIFPYLKYFLSDKGVFDQFVGL